MDNDLIQLDAEHLDTSMTDDGVRDGCNGIMYVAPGNWDELENGAIPGSLQEHEERIARLAKFRRRLKCRRKIS